MNIEKPDLDSVKRTVQTRLYISTHDKMVPFLKRLNRRHGEKFVNQSDFLDAAVKHYIETQEKILNLPPLL